MRMPSSSISRRPAARLMSPKSKLQHGFDSLRGKAVIPLRPGEVKGDLGFPVLVVERVQEDHSDGPLQFGTYDGPVEKLPLCKRFDEAAGEKF